MVYTLFAIVVLREFLWGKTKVCCVKHGTVEQDFFAFLFGGDVWWMEKADGRKCVYQERMAKWT